MVENALDDLQVAFGIALRRLRLAAGLTQEQLALDAGVQRNFVSLIELGQNQPSITTIAKLAHALAIRASDLVVAAETELSKPGGRARMPAR